MTYNAELTCNLGKCVSYSSKPQTQKTQAYCSFSFEFSSTNAVMGSPHGNRGTFLNLGPAQFSVDQSVN